MSAYFELKGFEHIYLEDSYVLGIEESEKQLLFKVELVLSEEHPRYSRPNKDEQYCYKKAEIVFDDLESVEWIERNRQSYLGADGTKDYGNIDSFELTPKGYHLLGDWGEVIINSTSPTLTWLE